MKFKKLQILIIFFLMSCNSKVNLDINNKKKLNQIISNFHHEEMVSYIPYQRNNSITVVDGEQLYEIYILKNNWTIFQDKNEVKNDLLNKRIKKTIDFAKNNNIFCILNEDNFTIIETNIYDSSYYELKENNSNFKDDLYVLYKTKCDLDDELSKYFYELIIMKDDTDPRILSYFKNESLIKYKNRVYYKRTLKNCDSKAPNSIYENSMK